MWPVSESRQAVWLARREESLTTHVPLLLPLEGALSWESMAKPLGPRRAQFLGHL